MTNPLLERVARAIIKAVPGTGDVEDHMNSSVAEMWRDCAQAAIDAYGEWQREQWVTVDGKNYPPRHTDIWAENRNGIQFKSRICAGMHEPFFTFPRGWKDASDTAPDWIDVVRWRPAPPQESDDGA